MVMNAIGGQEKISMMATSHRSDDSGFEHDRVEVLHCEIVVVIVE